MPNTTSRINRNRNHSQSDSCLFSALCKTCNLRKYSSASNKEILIPKLSTICNRQSAMAPQCAVNFFACLAIFAVYTMLMMRLTCLCTPLKAGFLPENNCRMHLFGLAPISKYMPFYGCLQRDGFLYMIMADGIYWHLHVQIYWRIANMGFWLCFETLVHMLRFKWCCRDWLFLTFAFPFSFFRQKPS